MRHFLFAAAALRERTSLDSAELQLRHRVWGCCTALIRDNLAAHLDAGSCGIVYVLKAGLCAEFRIAPPVLPLARMDEFLRDDLRTEARHGFIRIEPTRRWASTPQQSHTLLQEVLQIADSAELTRRLSLGMHVLTDKEYREIVEGLGPGLPAA